MTAPEPNDEPDHEQPDEQQVAPPVSPAYSTPPPEGLPDADNP